MRGLRKAFQALLCIMTLAAFAMPASAADDAPKKVPINELLARMNHALGTLSYEGTFIYLHDHKMQAMHVIRRADEQGGRERLTSLTGPLREVVRGHKTIQCILPDKRLVVMNSAHSGSHFPMIMAEGTEPGQLEASYDMKRLGHQRIAGRDCIVVSLRPKDHYRYGYRLWLDARTNLLLRSELMAANGRAIERVMFTQIEVPENVSPKALKPSVDSAGFKHRARADTRPAPAGSAVRIKVGRLPPGYERIVNESEHVGGDKAAVRHMVFSDGLASVSVFAAPRRPGKDALNGLSRRGAVHAFGRVVDGYQVTVVGEVPARTVKLVARSVRVMDGD
jgi:sigma-E factor negative regulatory protein RseB